MAVMDQSSVEKILANSDSHLVWFSGLELSDISRRDLYIFDRPPLKPKEPQKYLWNEEIIAGFGDHLSY